METNDQPTDPAALASRLVDVLSIPYEISGHQVVIGVSIGVSVAPEPPRVYRRLVGLSHAAIAGASSMA